MTVPLTVIVPFRIGPHPRRGWARLARLMAALPPELATIVVDDTADERLAAHTRRLVAARPNARHLRHTETAPRPFSIGRLRDAGTARAAEGLVLFHDVDFIAPPRAYRRLVAHAVEHGLDRDRCAVRCVPVFFLTRFGTAVFQAAPGRVWPALAERGGARRRGLADRLVLGSSAILLHRRHLLALGGHDGEFVGHGAEDFELLHRLSQHHPLGARPPRYHVDLGSRSRADDGFRAYFARYGQPLLDSGLALVHQWHPRRKEDPRYYAARRANFERLERRLAEGGAPR
jgi:predicted glycosyltransferase involved in capsule biosynthesis